MTESDNITHTLLDDEIHWIRLNNSNRQTIEDIFAIFEKYARQEEKSPTGKTLLYLVDGNGINELPVRYLVQCAEKWEKSQPFIPPTRTATIYNSNHLMLFAINMLIKNFTKYDNFTKVFPPDQRDGAIAWLKSNS